MSATRNLAELERLNTSWHGWKKVSAPQGARTFEISIEPGSLKNSTAQLEEGRSAARWIGPHFDSDAEPKNSVERPKRRRERFSNLHLETLGLSRSPQDQIKENADGGDAK